MPINLHVLIIVIITIFIHNACDNRKSDHIYLVFWRWSRAPATFALSLATLMLTLYGDIICDYDVH